MSLFNDERSARAPGRREVTIDRDFVRNEAREAVRQFFRPITAPFQGATRVFDTQEEAVRAAREIARRR